jgi:hypothetical protein
MKCGSLEYEASFALCDKFNLALVDKGWPHKYGGQTHTSEIEASMDLIFTVTLVNVWNIWRSLNVAERDGVQFKEAMELLAIEIVHHLT